jgi:hypothetical protein
MVHVVICRCSFVGIFIGIGGVSNIVVVDGGIVEMGIVAVDWSQSWRYSRRSDDLLAMLRIIRPHVHPIPSRRDERRETYSAAGRTLAGRDG